MEIRNIGEGICILGVMIAVALTENYWLLFFTALPIYTWLSTDNKVRDKHNDFHWKERELGIEKLKEEIRLLKLKKK